MGWLHTFIVFQCTILLLHGRPDGTSTTLASSSSPASLPKVNDDVPIQMEHPASVAAIVASLESKSAPAVISETRNHLPANIQTVQTIKRVMTPVTSIKMTEKPKEITSRSTAAPTIKTTRYNHISSLQSVHNNNTDHNNQLHVQESNKNINNNNNSMLNDENVKKSRYLHENKSNRQFVENVYTLNTYFSTTASPPTLYQTNQWPYAQILVSSLTTERPFQSFLAPATQTETILVNSDYLYDPTNRINPNQNYLNFNSNFENGEKFEYQIPKPLPPINPNPIVNIPYRRRPVYSTPSPTLLHLSKNITRLYSVIGSSTTPDPYNQYQKLHIKPPVTRRKVIKLIVTTKRSIKHNHNSSNNNKKHHSESCNGNCHNGNNNVNKSNKNGSKNGSNNNHNHNDSSNDDNDNSWDSGNHFNAVNVQYNESGQIISNFNSNPNLYSTYQSNGNNPNNFNTNFHTINQQLQNNTKSKECLIKFNSPNVPGENVCDTNDLKIIIKFDNPTAVNNTTEKPKQRKKRPSTPKTTTTTTPAPTSPLPFYYSANNEDDYYESTEVEKESGEFGSFLGPFQNIFGFGSDNEAQEKRPNRRRKPSHGQQNGGHGHNKPMAVPDINKYQTIILQSPAPPTMAPSPSTKHNIKKSTLLKFLAFLPILMVLKPALFGLWTLVLSPILVITIGGIALGVVLYPFLTISREQTISYSSPYRSARVVIHKHPRPKKRRPQNHIVIPADKRSRSPFVRRKTFSIEPHLRYRIVQSTPSRRRASISHRRWQPRPPIRIRTFHHHRSKRRAQDATFQQWLLIQNNFNVRVMSYNDGDNDFNDNYHS